MMKPTQIKCLITFLFCLSTLHSYGQCESDATKQETIDFINKTCSQYASGHTNEHYEKYEIRLEDGENPKMIISGDGFIPLLAIANGSVETSKFNLIFSIPIKSLSGTVILTNKGKYSRLELGIENGDKLINDEFSQSKGYKNSKMNNIAYILVKDYNIAKRIKTALEHLLCLYGRNKEKF